MHIAIVGVTGVRNRGVHALVDATLSEIRRRWPEAQISVLTSDLEYDRPYMPEGVRLLRDADRFFAFPRAVRPLVGAAQKAREMAGKGGGASVKALKTLDEADLVIALGGDIFSSDYGSAFLRRQVATVQAAQARGTPTVLLGHSIGPFASKDDENVMRGALEKIALVTVRESFTQKYMESTFGFLPARAPLTADVAFLMEPSPASRANAILDSFGLRDRPFVAMVPSQGITVFSSVKDNNAHDEAWIEAIRAVLDSTDCSILLIPHVQGVRPQSDDTQIAFRLLERMEFHPRIRAALGPYSARDYKAMIARARFLIGERMHSCIAALSSAVPTITIGYSVKARGIVHDIFGDDAERQNLIIPVSSFVEPGRIAPMIRSVADNLQPVSETLRFRLPTIIGRAADNFARLEPFLGPAHRNLTPPEAQARAAP